MGPHVPPSLLPVGRPDQGLGTPLMSTTFVALTQGPILTFVFRDVASQYEALARVETFYESEKHAGRYLSWDEARRERVCKGYQAFNLPLASVAAWLLAMRTCVPCEESDNEKPFWYAHCSEQERDVLHRLKEHGVLDEDGTLLSTTPCTYLISATATHTEISLAHERLHALYFLSPSYRALLTSLWDTMPRAIASAIECDLEMRGYKPSVWQDEMGAYLGVRTTAKGRRHDPCHEFGNKCAATCAEIRVLLLQRIPLCWQEDVGIQEDYVTISDSEWTQLISALTPAPCPPAPPTRGGRRRRR